MCGFWKGEFTVRSWDLKGKKEAVSVAKITNIFKSMLIGYELNKVKCGWILLALWQVKTLWIVHFWGKCWNS